MKKIAKQMLTGLLAIAMVLTMGTPAIPKVYAQDTTQVEYEIYRIHMTCPTKRENMLFARK